ncbi:uncharacterized protein [Euwallacea similis]|uniref:uncharacterized protein n=1 Tax=Euwallacea similis TaxID=1736056 RepID=UPI00344C2E3E
MAFRCVLLAVTLGACVADRDDKKWVWNQSGRSANARSFTNPINSRYNVFEEVDEYQPQGANNLFNSAQNSALANQRPPLPPPVAGLEFLPEERPGGVYGGTAPFKPAYGGLGPYRPEASAPLTGPVPSWVQEGPIKNFDKCKCAEKFNCNSPGISYGHCDVGKQYCCYSSRKDFGGPIPSRPVHSLENGVLVGPGGPIDPLPGGINNFGGRPNKQVGLYGAGRPEGFGAAGGIRGQNEYSPANGILVGPGGPLDGFGLGRTANVKP